MNKTIYSLANETQDTLLLKIANDMLAGNKGFVKYTSKYTGKDGFISYIGLPQSKWGLCMFFPEDEFMEDNIDLSNRIIIPRVIGFVLLLSLIIFISRTITKPIKVVAKSVVHKS